MILLHKLGDFSVPLVDLVTIYMLYIRSILDQSCQVWHTSLTLENFHDLERVQINALTVTGLSTLFERRQNLSLKFAKACFRNTQTKHMIPTNPVSPDDHYTLHHYTYTRFKEQFVVTKTSTERLNNSAIPYMQGC